MQVKNEQIKECDGKLLKIVESTVYCYCGENIKTKSLMKDYTFTCIERNGKINIYAAKGGQNIYRDIMEASMGAGFKLVAVGIHIAIARDNLLRPTLGLLQLLRLHNCIKRNYAIITEHAEKLFLYGRDVLPESITTIDIWEKSRCEGRLVVMNKNREPLGWGRLRRKGNRLYIQNIIDAGWYLRSGV